MHEETIGEGAYFVMLEVGRGLSPHLERGDFYAYRSMNSVFDLRKGQLVLIRKAETNILYLAQISYKRRNKCNLYFKFTIVKRTELVLLAKYTMCHFVARSGFILCQFKRQSSCNVLTHADVEAASILVWMKNTV